MLARPLPTHPHPLEHAGIAARPVVGHITTSRRGTLHCQAAKGDRGGSSGRGGSSRGGGGSKRSGSKQKPQRAAQPGSAPGKQKQREQQQQQALVPPLRTQVLGELSTSDRMPEPLWSTFCGVTNGLWCGITSAHSPFTGGGQAAEERAANQEEGSVRNSWLLFPPPDSQWHGGAATAATPSCCQLPHRLSCPPFTSSPAGQAEPLALDAAGKPLALLHQCCVEQRAVGEDGADSVVRCVGLRKLLSMCAGGTAGRTGHDSRQAVAAAADAPANAERLALPPLAGMWPVPTLWRGCSARWPRAATCSSRPAQCQARRGVQRAQQAQQAAASTSAGRRSGSARGSRGWWCSTAAATAWARPR